MAGLKSRLMGCKNNDATTEEVCGCSCVRNEEIRITRKQVFSTQVAYTIIMSNSLIKFIFTREAVAMTKGTLPMPAAAVFTVVEQAERAGGRSRCKLENFQLSRWKPVKSKGLCRSTNFRVAYACRETKSQCKLANSQNEPGKVEQLPTEPMGAGKI